VKQTMLPKKIIVVNDNSTDSTCDMVTSYTKKYDFIDLISTNSSKDHMPGSKVINAFYQGFKAIDTNYDIICKFDADLIFPSNYLEKIILEFKKNSKTGMVGGFCYIQEGNDWNLENLTNKDHIRGALKAYRKECFKDIGGLKPAMGWDTVDELLAQFHNWNIVTDESLHVKHLKPTGTSTSKKKTSPYFGLSTRVSQRKKKQQKTLGLGRGRKIYSPTTLEKN